MRVAVMQPYFLPYIGYFQLMAAVDVFVILDDVNYIKGGWINRNFIMIDGIQHWLTIPLNAASQNVEIRDITIAPDTGWKVKMKRSVERAYRKSSEKTEIKDMFFQTIGTAEGNLSQFLRKSLQEICLILKIETEVIPTSSQFVRDDLKGQERIIRICQELGADSYVNLSGGRALYRKEDFEAAHIELTFMEQTISVGRISTGLGGSPFISILDLLMRNSGDVVSHVLQEFTMNS